MGWTYTGRMRGQGNQEFFAKEFPSLTFLASATVRGTFYAAVKHVHGGGDTFALVCLTRWAPKDAYNFGYKDMDETMGPCEAACPARILKLLTPLEPGKYPSAEDWRARAWVIANRPTPKVGQTIVMDSPVYFAGIPESILTKVSIPRRKDVYSTPSGRLVRLSRLKNYGYRVQA